MRTLLLASAIAAGLLLQGAGAGSGHARPGSESVVIVVNGDNAARETSRADLSRMFLRKLDKWPSGQLIEPVDQSVDAPARRIFSTWVHGRSAQAIAAFWQQQVFAGRGTPPVEQGADADVLRYVASHQGAVGYVSAGAQLPAGVRVLRVLP